MHLILAVLTLFHHAPKPKYDGVRWSCPASYSVYADQGKAETGKRFTYCVK
jgi:hypothetical protein